MAEEISIDPSADALPFDHYPSRGRILLGRVSGDSCRHGYGLKFIQVTKLTKCAYCGLDLVTNYEYWLTMALDHVVPRSACMEWKLREDWQEDYSNRVLCCITCNTFGNRYKPLGFQCPATLEEFYKVRDAIFIERKRNILLRHKQERAFFEKPMWVS